MKTYVGGHRPRDLNPWHWWMTRMGTRRAKQQSDSSAAESPAEASARSSEEQNQLVIWETTSGAVRELHLCEGHHRDLIGSLRLSGVGCSAVPSQQPCQACENNGDWPDLTHTPGSSAATNEAT